VDRRAAPDLQRAQPPITEYLRAEGYDRDSLVLLLQANAQRVYGVFRRAGGAGRDASEPDIPTPAAFYIPELPAFVSTVLEMPSKLSQRFLLLENLDDREPRPFGAVIPDQEL
jgi:hypothetical protein